MSFSNKRKLILGLAAMAGIAGSAQTVTIPPPIGEDICLFSSLDLNNITCLSGESVRADLSTQGNKITLRDTIYTSGVGTHAPSVAVIKVNGATRFVACLGIDDEAESAADKDNHGICNYVIRKHTGGDKTGVVVKEGTIDRRDKGAVRIDLDITGWDYITLEAQTGTQNWADHVDWANAYFVFSGKMPTTITPSQIYPDESKVVDLPKAGEDGAEIIPLSSLETQNITTGWGNVMVNRSVDGNPITLNDTVYNSGVGLHATGQVVVKLNGAVTRFVTRLGIDDEVAAEASQLTDAGVCNYRVSLKAESGDTSVVGEGTIRVGQAETPLIAVDCREWKYLIIEFPEGDGGNTCDHVDLANAYFEYREQNSTPPAIVAPDEIASKLACATTVYSQPGIRFMQKVRATDASARITVTGLPDGLAWNATRQLVEGTIDTEGTYTYYINIESDGETSVEPVTLTVSSKLQQPVPLMGWLSWNVFEEEINDEKVRAVADAMVKYGLKDAGYRYLCIDDLWHASARESGTGKPTYDTTKFPHGMNDLADYVHAKGLKFGIYSDAAEYTCAGAFGSYGYEKIDAKQYADWTFDLLKYDYCHAPSSQATAYTRYKAMGDALKESGRDILYYMCEWGVREPWKWGAETGATCWRCTYDTRDCWTGQSGGIGVLQSIAGMKDIWAYSGPNRYNDADMMCVGLHGTGKSSNDLCATGPGMTQTEYRTQFSLWCMWASPLTLSFDVRKISDADLAIITNEEMIAIDQDRLGQQAEFIGESKNIQTYMKDLENGDVAVAVVNLASSRQYVNINFSELPALDAGKKYLIRDLWEKKDLGTFADAYNTNIAAHETKVYRLTPAGSTDGITQLTGDECPTVATGQNGVTVTWPGTAGLDKRVLISDLKGHVLTADNNSRESFTLPTPATAGVYIVNVVCNGRSQSVKFTVK